MKNNILIIFLISLSACVSESVLEVNDLDTLNQIKIDMSDFYVYTDQSQNTYTNLSTNENLSQKTCFTMNNLNRLLREDNNLEKKMYDIEYNTRSLLVRNNLKPGNGNGGGNGGGKIVCTMMNESYGFGSFRNKIWMKFHKDLSPEYQKGYHKLFLPLVRIAKTNKVVKKVLEHIAVHSTIDMRQATRGKTHLLGRVYRKILLPLCYWVGKNAKR